MNIKLRVNNLIEKFHTRNPFKIANKLGIEIIYSHLGEIKGFYKTILKRKFIVINSEMTEFEQKLVCAHELGHAYLHSTRQMKFMLDHTRISRRSKIEDEANTFMKHLIFEDNEECYSIENLEKIDYYVFEEIKRL